MEAGYTDRQLEEEIQRLQTAIRVWAEKYDLWEDCSFKEYLSCVGAEPGSPAVVTILISEGDLARVLDEDLEMQGTPFRELLEGLGYTYENQNGYAFHLYAEDEKLNLAFEAYFHWKWVCSLIQPDIGDIHEELYAHFRANPSDLHRLTPRAFEILLSRVFQTQGFSAEPGPGSDDGGIDVKLWQRDPLGDVLTLVQAKRYAPHLKIKLEAVAALHGVMSVERAPRGIFVTTSEYLPSARKFAARAGNIVQLATTHDVVRWCETARGGIVKDKSTLVSRTSVERLLSQVCASRDARVLHAHGGYNMVLNHFAVVLKETRHAALLMSLPHRVVSDDGYGQRGFEVPAFGIDAVSMHQEESVWRAKRRVADDGGVSYWDGRNLYFAWSGEPAPFDYAD
nr:restriction endonuclease [uncultured Roseateles sp.]